MSRGKNMNYKAFFSDNFSIVNKEGQEVDFNLNPIQEQFESSDITPDQFLYLVLKARQQGFSSDIEARFTADFLTLENSQSVVIADIQDNAIARLDQVKAFIKSYELKNKIKVPLKYNSRQELVNEAMNSKYFIGTGENVDFGRSRTINNLHISEAAFIKNFRKLLAGVLQALVPNGFAVIETTANGFNEFKEFWEQSELGLTGFKPLFYPADKFYDANFLEEKKKQLGRYYPQEYPNSALEAFLTSGDSYFDVLQLKLHVENSKEPMVQDFIY
jgi:hypothetical protein